MIDAGRDLANAHWSDNASPGRVDTAEFAQLTGHQYYDDSTFRSAYIERLVEHGELPMGASKDALETWGFSLQPPDDDLYPAPPEDAPPPLQRPKRSETLAYQKQQREQAEAEK